MTILLENLIMKLTLATPSGGRCRIGEASFSVWYCADIWEWEYLGVTYWDVEDLANAMAKAGAAPFRMSPDSTILAGVSMDS